MSEREPEQPYRNVPRDSVDAQFQLLNTLWGNEAEINTDFREKLTKKSYYVDENGDPKLDEGGNLTILKTELWSQLALFTRDLKLGNLSDASLRECSHYCDLAADCINEGYMGAAVVAISRVARIIELSQSHKGFARKWAATLRTVTDRDDEAAKKKM